MLLSACQCCLAMHDTKERLQDSASAKQPWMQSAAPSSEGRGRVNRHIHTHPSLAPTASSAKRGLSSLLLEACGAYGGDHATDVALIMNSPCW